MIKRKFKTWVMNNVTKSITDKLGKHILIFMGQFTHGEIFS